MYLELSIVTLIIYNYFVFIKNIFIIFYGTYNIKYCQLNYKIF